MHIHSGQRDREKKIAFDGAEVWPRLRRASSRKAARSGLRTMALAGDTSYDFPSRPLAAALPH